jgi:hypothetical protein
MHAVHTGQFRTCGAAPTRRGERVFQWPKVHSTTLHFCRAHAASLDRPRLLTELEADELRRLRKQEAAIIAGPGAAVAAVDRRVIFPPGLRRCNPPLPNV